MNLSVFLYAAYKGTTVKIIKVKIGADSVLDLTKPAVLNDILDKVSLCVMCAV